MQHPDAYQEKQDSWDAWRPIWHIAFYVMVVLVWLLVLSDGTVSNGTQFLVLNVVFVLWYSVTVRLPPQHWKPFPLRLSLYLIFGWVIWGTLALSSTHYYLFLFFLFPHLFMYLPFRWAVGGAGILNSLVLILLYQISPDLVSMWMLLTLVSMVGSIILAYFINDIINQSRERKRLLQELQSTQRQLQEAERLAGISDERQRLAGDLHDTLVQSLISIVTHLEAVEMPSIKMSHLHPILLLQNKQLAMR